ncbi:MAG: alpha-ribazole phosphatase [Dissulfurispiraceae bacterium]|jgi:alpha-ribazole phosphatase/probable phosphoglycerate mutase|nr:alpha-ribazole phosphatase [Dissulfurispiraceae bacterium]
MVKTIYLVRHGETVGHKHGQYKGSMDIPLSERGAEQVRRSAEFIAADMKKGKAQEKSSLKVYCSPLSRARRSAEIIAARLSVKSLQIDDLRERSFGRWEGMTYMEIAEKYPGEFSDWRTNPLKFSPPEGESTLEVNTRVLSVLDRILLSSSDGESIIIVAHGGVNRVLLCSFLGMPLEHIFRIEQNFAGVSIIEMWDELPVVKLLNWTSNE